jgi:TonB family protein
MKKTEVIEAEEKKDEVGGYDILGLIARGGMAEIYKAKKTGVKGFEKVIALKKILAGYGKDDKYVEMFVDEAKIAAELTHPNIVQIYDLGKKDDYYFIAMEYVQGKDLRLILRKLTELGQLLPEPISIYLALEVLKALNYAHTAKSSKGKNLDIVHRDISPPNILVSYVGDVKLTDFGVSKASIKMHHTVAGALKGKLLYMSPEQAKAEKDVDYRSDLYAVGIILYELITGEKLFFATSEVGILQKVQSGDVPKPSLLRKDIDPHLEIILMRMLNKDKNKRYQKASDIIGDLRDYLGKKYSHMPTAIHLSHTICDLFQQEIAKEDTRIDIKPLPYKIKKKEKPIETPVEKPLKEQEEEEILRLDEDSIIQPEPDLQVSLQMEEPLEAKPQEPPAQQEEEAFHPLIEIDLDGEQKEEPISEPAEPIPTTPIQTDFQHMEKEFHKKKKFLFILLGLVVILGAVVIFILVTGSSDENGDPAAQAQTGITESKPAEKEPPPTETGVPTPTVETDVSYDAKEADTAAAAGSTPPKKTVPPQQAPTQEKTPVKTGQAETKTPAQTTVPAKPPVKEPPVVKQEQPRAAQMPTQEKPAAAEKQEKAVEPTTTTPATATETPTTTEEQEPQQKPVQQKPDVKKPPQQAPVQKAVREGDTVSINDVDTQPTPLTRQSININPSYTRTLQGMENVFVTYLIDHNGRVETVRIIKKSSSKRINALIEKAISRWRFKPAIKNNVRVKVWKTVSLTIKK